MQRKTQVHAVDGRQEILITRDFNLPVALLFKAYIEPEIVEQWMGTKVLKLENKNHGGYRFETTDPMGNKHLFSGVIHNFSTNQNITRTFEMENTAFPPQLEFLDFIAISEDTSQLRMQMIFKSIAHRDQLLKMPFAQGINMAHHRLESIFK